MADEVFYEIVHLSPQDIAEHAGSPISITFATASSNIALVMGDNTKVHFFQGNDVYADLPEFPHDAHILVGGAFTDGPANERCVNYRTQALKTRGFTQVEIAPQLCVSFSDFMVDLLTFSVR